MEYHWDFSFLWTHYRLLLWGLLGVAKLSVVTLMAGLALGVIFGMARASRSRVMRFLGSCYVEFFRNIPPLVQIFWFYYTIPILTGQQGSAFVSALAALSLYGGAYFAEIFRSGIESIERTQWEAGKAIGFGYFQIMHYIVLPQSVRRIVPALTNQAIEGVKLTTLASSIAYAELLYYAKLIANQEFRPLEAYTVAAVIYIAICALLSYVAVRLEHWFQRSQ